MNLAEIRKKALGVRKPEEQDLCSAEETICSELPEISLTDMLSASSGEEQAEEPLEYDFPSDTFADEFCQPLDLEREQSGTFAEFPDQFEAQEVDMTGLQGSETFTPDQPESPLAHDITVSAPEAGITVEVPVEALSATVRHPAYDPVAILLAGRKSAEENDVSAIDGVDQVSGDLEEYLCFKVADEEYALSIMAIKEIIKPREVTEVPRMPRFVSGVISLRGVIIPIMDMRLRLSLAVQKPTGRERVLVLKTSNGLCGILVDEVIQVVRFANSAIEGPPAILDGVDREFVMGLGRFDNRMLILLNLESILDLKVH